MKTISTVLLQAYKILILIVKGYNLDEKTTRKWVVTLLNDFELSV